MLDFLLQVEAVWRCFETCGWNAFENFRKSLKKLNLLIKFINLNLLLPQVVMLSLSELMFVMPVTNATGEGTYYTAIGPLYDGSFSCGANWYNQCCGCCIWNLQMTVKRDYVYLVDFVYVGYYFEVLLLTNKNLEILPFFNIRENISSIKVIISFQ